MTTHISPLLLLGLLVGSGCDRGSQPAAAADLAQPAAAGPVAKACAQDLDCGSTQLCLHTRCAEITPKLPECGVVRVRFATDSADIPAEEQPKLDHTARCLRVEQELHVTIEGNADERGSKPYNQELGDKRATAVEKYLVSKGVAAEQLRTVSFGEENPLCITDDAACYARNRRAAVKPEGKRGKR